MRYPIHIKPDGKHFLVTFPDIPEALTQGETVEEALAMAAEALETALDFYFEQPREVPEPSHIKRGGKFVELPASLSAKVLLLNEMIRQRVRPAELARRTQYHAAGDQPTHQPPPHLEDRRNRRSHESPRQDTSDSRRLGVQN